MARPARAYVDLSALRHNYLHARQLAGGARAVAVLKANAYGHGAVPATMALADIADAFGVACIDEAMELRESGITTPILLLEGCFSPDELPVADALGFWLAVHTPEQLDRPTPEAAALQPVMTLASEIISVRDLPAGDHIGYGARFQCPAPMRMGVVAMGYGDGYPRDAADGTPVLVNGRRTRLIGRVSMDMLTVDLTGLERVAVGDPVELWGTDLPVSEVARASNTIPYELLTRMTGRVPLIHGNAQPLCPGEFGASSPQTTLWATR